MEDVDSAGQLHRVNGPVRVSIKVLDDLQNSGAAEALKRLRVRVFCASLRPVESKPNLMPNLCGELFQIVAARPDSHDILHSSNILYLE